MRTIERNYIKNPHTARFLQTFHSGIGSNGRNYREEMAMDNNQAEIDLLALVADTTDRRSPAQAALMNRLIDQITELDSELGAAARTWTDKATAAGHWTAGREGNASAWIGKMISKISELKAASKTDARKTTAPMPEVADGRYAVEEDGVLKFFKVKNGNRPGFVFLDIQASDDWHGVRQMDRIRKVVALIAEDAEEASLRYGRELGICGDCGRTLTDETSRARGRGPVCDAKH